VDVQLQRFASRLAKRELNLDISEAAKDLLGNIGFDPTFGARPLKRAIQAHLENPLAQEILAGQYQPGDTIVVEVNNGELAFGRTPAGASTRDERPNAPGGRA
jgi:ATP-dependent Clp protease ATP-binding subunit ClpB